MPKLKVTCRELVYVDRTYVIEAEDASAARRRIMEDKGGDHCIEEVLQHRHAFGGPWAVEDEAGNSLYAASLAGAEHDHIDL